jgi:hypothetical protein
MLRRNKSLATVVQDGPALYACIMELARHFLGLTFLVLVMLTSVTASVSAAKVFEPRLHCLDGISEALQIDLEHGEHTHDHSELVSQHALVAHDHETCMNHSCPAISPDMQGADAPNAVLITNLVWPEQSLISPEQTDALKRPPRD